MLIPIKHENMTARRWPVITLGLIVVNVICLLLTSSSIKKDSENPASLTRAHILILAASHPGLTMKPETQKMVDEFKEAEPGKWKELTNEFRPLADGWDAQQRMYVEEFQFQNEMTRLEEEYARLQVENMTQTYAFVPGKRTVISYLTANFLHGGWLHLIFNMWFLWLAGFVLEDTWGRPLYLMFYLWAGAVALQFYAAFTPHSMTPVLGASGAVAGLMGAFLVRFPTLQIDMAWLWMTLRFRLIRFKAPAWSLLPLWLLGEVFSGYLFGNADGVAHWSHVGGFLFGAIFALIVRATGIEKKLTKKVTEEMELAHDQEIQQASDLIGAGKAVEAQPILEKYVRQKPESLDGWALLAQVYRKKNDMSAWREACLKMCALHVKADELEQAERDVADYMTAGGDMLPAQLWMQRAQAYERAKDWDRAVHEYTELAKGWPSQRESVQALIAAAKVSLHELQKAKQALDFYNRAKESPAPHADMQAEIEAGIQEATAKVPNFGFANQATSAHGFGAELAPAWTTAGTAESAYGTFDPGSTDQTIETMNSWEPTTSVAPVEIEPPHAVPVPVQEQAPEPKAMAAVASAAAVKATVKTETPAKPATWGEFDAPPVWGHGAKGDTVHIPHFGSEDKEHN